MAFSAQNLKYDFSYNMHFFSDCNPIHMVRPYCKSGHVARKHEPNKSQFWKNFQLPGKCEKDEAHTLHHSRLSSDGMYLQASSTYSIFHNWHHMKTHQTNDSKLSKAAKTKMMKTKTF